MKDLILVRWQYSSNWSIDSVGTSSYCGNLTLDSSSLAALCQVHFDHLFNKVSSQAISVLYLSLLFLSRLLGFKPLILLNLIWAICPQLQIPQPWGWGCPKSLLKDPAQPGLCWETSGRISIGKEKPIAFYLHKNKDRYELQTYLPSISIHPYLFSFY